MDSPLSTPELPGARFERLGADDADALQRLFERCSDFFELAEGVPTRPEVAAEELAFRAPGKTDEETSCFGVFVDDRLAGFAHLTRGFPKPGEWWLGFLIFDPSERRRGLGAAVHGAIVEWIASQSGSALWLAVLEQNEAAQRFWTRLGYIERERQPWVAATGFKSILILMSLAIASKTGPAHA